MNNRLKQCPVCNSSLYITEYHCDKCQTTIKGKFGEGDLSALTSVQLEFVKTFLLCQGNIKEVEKELGISYPTVKNRLSEITAVLTAPQIPSQDEILNVLDEIERGEISVEKALKKINK